MDPTPAQLGAQSLKKDLAGAPVWLSHLPHQPSTETLPSLNSSLETETPLFFHLRGCHRRGSCLNRETLLQRLRIRSRLLGAQLGVGTLSN